ncbi:hypothetical protein SARC_05802 [Sphaeroforma arctica JP610]|uniref:Uncharacterized protein n=1 Tax=Sphaeroforma arctica JP610 TaxID=667725 RepID=A0A0L0FZ23_9EUKA|nr:hypothetical protein SARC_05802 [Sphaeroforma arctica JP610]KNC81889.1 hypothetical protein SARC_05802 [Sphaeroforma arctica JP610]|eukprot:XP_014155791.1 hypothetical protein SARC_05802 [Sphaeroforma arctica JP610]
MEHSKMEADANSAEIRGNLQTLQELSMPSIASVLLPAAGLGGACGSLGYIHAIVTKQPSYARHAAFVGANTGLIGVVFFGFRAFLNHNQPGQEMSATIMSGMLVGSFAALKATNPRAGLASVVVVGAAAGVGQLAHDALERMAIKKHIKNRFPEHFKKPEVKPDHGLHTANRHPYFWTPIIRNGVNDYREHLHKAIKGLLEEHEGLRVVWQDLKDADEREKETGTGVGTETGEA